MTPAPEALEKRWKRGMRPATDGPLGTHIRAPPEHSTIEAEVPTPLLCSSTFQTTRPRKRLGKWVPRPVRGRGAATGNRTNKQNFSQCARAIAPLIDFQMCVINKTKGERAPASRRQKSGRGSGRWVLGAGRGNRNKSNRIDLK